MERRFLTSFGDILLDFVAWCHVSSTWEPQQWKPLGFQRQMMFHPWVVSGCPTWNVWVLLKVHQIVCVSLCFCWKSICRQFAESTGAQNPRIQAAKHVRSARFKMLFAWSLAPKSWNCQVHLVFSLFSILASFFWQGSLLLITLKPPSTGRGESPKSALTVYTVITPPKSNITYHPKRTVVFQPSFCWGLCETSREVPCVLQFVFSPCFFNKIAPRYGRGAYLAEHCTKADEYAVDETLGIP